MRELKRLDQVAYIRFASVYRSFQGVDDFQDAIKEVQRPTARFKPRTVAKDARTPRHAKDAKDTKEETSSIESCLGAAIPCSLFLRVLRVLCGLFRRCSPTLTAATWPARSSSPSAGSTRPRRIRAWAA